MEYTSNIVLSLLLPYRGKPYIKTTEKKAYRWAALLPDNSNEMEEDMLYVCRLSEAMARNREHPSCHFVCICDRYLSEDEREDAEAMNNLILVEENRSVSWLLNKIQNRFLELDRWEKDMKDVLLSGGGYQDLLDVSEHYLKNALFVLDSAYRLLAYSKTYKSSDPLNMSLYENGCYTSTNMQRFYDYNHVGQYFSATGITKGNPGEIAQFESLSKWCWYDGTPLIKTVEVFCNSPIYVESAELFDLLMHYINICFLKEQKSIQSSGRAYGHFMRDMIYNGLSDIDQIAKCAKQTGFPIVGNFDAYRIIFRDENKVLPGQFVQEISALLPCSKTICKDFEGSILNIYSSPGIEEASKRNIGIILPVVEEHGGMIGVSAPFTRLSGLSHACTQAAIALQYGRRSYRYTPLPDKLSPGIYYYDSIQIYHMLHTCSNGPFDFFRSNPYLNKLNELTEYDREHESGLAEILFWYLYYERRATETGKKLHMHRNTVMYHIQHINDILNMDFDDYITRMQMMLAYHYVEMSAAKMDNSPVENE